MIPLLIAELDTTADAATFSWILSAFGEMGPAAKSAIPAILRKVQASPGLSNVHGIDLSSVGLGALKKIDPEAAAKVGVRQNGEK